ncbi:TonB-dependent receptor [Acidocella sp.]|uniref:TonB-dependent receptor n=1 Tax=Acidocella sp. TaxID=50710 RepID=UPI00262F0D7C|nr:TonB-dependent receptor [Acidocella sp.]MDD2796108.1 TonB-dependent receptor [Acidocella sp.]
MNSANTFRRALRRASSHRALAFALAGLVLTTASAHAQTSTAPVNLDLGAVLATGTADTALLASTPGTAPNEAPSLTPLNSTQPTSVVSKKTIENMLIGTQSYADIAKLTPSVSAISPNGPGLQEANGPTIRGFQDGQYNITFDGIPFGDSNDFTHHSTSFFTDSQIGETIVDRGPGTAETVGDATFGGTISLRTIDPAATQTLTPYGEWGSYNTNLAGIRYDTGSIQTLNGTSAVVDAEHIQSDGALQNAGQERKNFFGKIVIPAGNNTTVTLMADYNNIYQNPAIGATAGQMAQYGRNFAYSTDPNQQNYNRYNNDHIVTDMEYIDVQSNLGDGWLYDGKVYTYAYYHHDLNGDDVNDVGANGLQTGVPNQVQLLPGGPITTGVPGQTFKMDYRSVGTIQRAQKDFDWGDLKAGFWFDHQINSRAVQNVSLTNANAVNYNPADSNGGLITPTNADGSIERQMRDQLYTFQPYGQVDWKPIDGLTLTGGVKYAFFRRTLSAPVDQKTELPLYYSHNYDKLLPSFEAKYSINPNLSVYAQAAEGFLAPNLNTYYTTGTKISSVQPETTINFQAGMAYQGEHLALGADVYHIHFQNFINSQNETIGGIRQKVFFNQGGVIYRGVEGDVTYSFDNGISLFGNAGYNQAYQTSTNIYVLNAPQFTSNIGVIYDKDGIYGSIIDQTTGGSYTGNTGVNVVTGAAEGSGASGKNPGGWYNPYNVVNLAAGYTFNHLNPHLDQINLKLNVDNITNQRQIISDNGTNGAGDLLYWVLPGVSAFVTISVPINF